MADQHETGEVVGIDLSPIQPIVVRACHWVYFTADVVQVPPNCSFLVDDAELTWDDPKKYHLIHFRNMEGAFREWPRIHRQVWESLEPGGTVQIQSLDFDVYAQQGEVPDPIRQWVADLYSSASERGTPIDVAYRHKNWLREVGFMDVSADVTHIPLGSWAEEKNLRNVGQWNLIATLHGLEAYSMVLLVENGKFSPEEVLVRLSSVRKEYKENCCARRMFSKVVMIAARKPG
ncbi:uncharacterized protein HMPREF1541_09028 [Cyphellophora europaea CBS 101466]|uniref:Methyltransferase domain-containing protein n=1 Tax=Cyphellophora europaea (strain CBS 101466) TaxID=1220924 RepID=W2RK78_CYPE1|nr:uncharacterized protein HMPREF1541_09028 [Cyphellophora europaea CBS 101466]ETN36750.1 hypothetical protein HMPREF1541_09028 [Cyphellophora europaea CBS 101466]